MQQKWTEQVEQHMLTFFRNAKLDHRKWFRELATPEEKWYAYFVVRRRMIQPKNYILHESKHLAEKELKPEIKRAYEDLKFALQTKGDLKKFHTENSKILAPLDGLLEKYNINHLHIDRSRYQVFFITERKHIFLINVVQHFGRSRTEYNKEALLKIVTENWPEKKQNKTAFLPNEKLASAYGWEKVTALRQWLSSLEAFGDGDILCIENDCFQFKKLIDNNLTQINAQFDI